jgi:SAM-dependent methyltransferase
VSSREWANPHRSRDVAESFGSDAERYDRSRPRYPDAMLEHVLAEAAGRDVLDVGIGTGIAARQFESRGCRVLGVDVDARMADFARNCGFEVEVATFEDWDSRGRKFDLVIAGQTWHWVDPVGGAAKAAEVLGPDGRLAVFWNVDKPRGELAEAFAAVYERVRPDSIVARRWIEPSIVDGYSMLALNGYARIVEATVRGIEQCGGFNEPEELQFDWEQLYTKDEWLDLVPTTGDHSQFSPEQLNELLTGLASAIDHMGGSFVVDYTTLLVSAATLTGGLNEGHAAPPTRGTRGCWRSTARSSED